MDRKTHSREDSFIERMWSGRDSPNMDDSRHSLSQSLRKSLRISLRDEISPSDEISVNSNETNNTRNEKGSDQEMVDRNIADLQRELARLKVLRIVAKGHEHGQGKAIATLREEREELQRAIDRAQKAQEEKEETILHNRERARHLRLMVQKMEEEKEEIAENLKRTKEEKEQLKKTLGVLDSPEVSSLIRKRCHSWDDSTSLASLLSEKTSPREAKQAEMSVDERRSKWAESKKRETRRSGSFSELSAIISRSSKFLIGVEKELLDIDDSTNGDDETNSLCASECLWTSSESMATGTSNRSLNAERRSSMERFGSKRMLLASNKVASARLVLSSRSIDETSEAKFGRNDRAELEVAHEDIPSASTGRRGRSIENLLMGLKQEAQ